MNVNGEGHCKRPDINKNLPVYASEEKFIYQYSTMNWSEEQVLALSPDASSTKSGKDLARHEKWQTLAIDTKALWGEIKGSGSTPYRTQIALPG